jgi:hypothetical protein
MQSLSASSQYINVEASFSIRLFHIAEASTLLWEASEKSSSDFACLALALPFPDLHFSFEQPVEKNAIKEEARRIDKLSSVVFGRFGVIRAHRRSAVFSSRSGKSSSLLF